MIADALDADASILTSVPDRRNVRVGSEESRVQKQVSGNLMPVEASFCETNSRNPSLRFLSRVSRTFKKVCGGKRKKKLRKHHLNSTDDDDFALSVTTT